MEIVTTIGSKLGEYFVEATIHQARYLFCFNNIVKDMEDKANTLKHSQERIKNDVETEQRNSKEIYNDVAKWLEDVRNVLEDVEKLKEEIQVKRSCLNGWCPNWGFRYWLGRKAINKTTILLNLQNSRKFDTMAHPKPLPGIEFFAPSDFMFFEATKKAFDDIMKALKDEKIKMLGLHGTGGVGKTTLAKVAGIELKQQKIFDEVVVAIVSQHPDVKKIQNELAEPLGLRLVEENIEERAKRLYSRFSEPKSKILIILDDVWKKQDLKNELGIPVDDNHSGCKILLTTRRRRVCDLMPCDSQISLGTLEPEEGLALLKNYAGIHGDHPTLIDVLEEIACECKGLPLAIAAVGSALRGKDIDEWKRVSWKLKNAKLKDIDDADVDVYTCLKLSYDYLRDEEAKLCFMFCSLYPEDHEINLEDLVRYGVGWGWYQDVSIEIARSLLRGTIKELKASSLLLDTGKEGFVKMHDIVRDVAIWMGSNEKTFLSKAGFGVMKWPKDEAMGQYKAISLVETKIEELPEELVCLNLHILLLGSQFSEMVILDQFFEGMKTLKIVTIIGGNLSLKSFQYLTDLQVLQLTQCRIRDLAFLGELKTLQILCFKNSSFDEILEENRYQLREFKLLEVTGVSLKNLKQLEVEGCNNLTFLFTPSQARTLVHLEEIVVDDCKRLKCIIEAKFDGNEKEKHIFREDEITILLPRLRKLSLSTLPNLISFCSENYYSTWEALQELSLYGCPSLNINDEVKVSVQYLMEELRILKVECCYNLCDAIPVLLKHGLKKLESLYIGDVGGVKVVFQQVEEDIMMGDGHHQVSKLLFPSLKTLRLWRLPEVEVLYKDPMRIFTLQNLTTLHVCGCSRLTHVLSPTLAQNLLQLEELHIIDCSELEQIIDNGEHIVYDHRQPVSFPKLKSLTISRCPKLKRLFHISVAPSLQNLWWMTIKDNDELEEVFWHEDGADVIMDHKKIVMTQLQRLELRYLPKLQWIWKAPAHDVSLKNLSTLRVYDCSRLRHVLSPTLAQNLLQLEYLTIEDCSELEQIIDEDDNGEHIVSDHRQPAAVCFPKLKSLTISRCPKLKRLFHISVAPSLQKLERMFIDGSDELEEVFWHEDGADVIMDHKEIVMTQLQSLELRYLPKLRWIWKAPAQDEITIVLPVLRELSLRKLPNIISLCSENNYAIWLALETLILFRCPLLNISNEVKVSGQYLKEKLQRLEVEGCDSLGDAIPALLKHGLKSLEGLYIIRVGGVKVVFQQVEEDIIMGGGDGHPQGSKLLFPSLKILSLWELPEVEVLYKDPAHIFSLQNLTCLRAYKCNRLRHVLSPTLARNLLQLEYLTIEDCSELEQIIDEDDTDEHIVYDRRQPAAVCFPKLAILTVQKCPKLKRLFQIGVAPSLQNLYRMTIEDNDELEEVFWHEDGADVIMDHKKIVMTQLQELVLRNLPKLTNFSPVSSQFVCPSLRTKRIEECPKYRTDSKALQYSTGQEEASEQFPSETT